VGGADHRHFLPCIVDWAEVYLAAEGGGVAHAALLAR
jgi:hypothetical protein